MKIKIFLNVLLIFLLTGCTPKLTYTILNSSITETIEIPFSESYTEEQVQQKLDYYSLGRNQELSINVEKIKEGYNATVSSGSMSMIDYFNNDNALINECYEMVNFISEDDKYYINTSKGFKCLAYDYNFSDEIVITVQTYNKVYQHNADKVDGTKYIWNITQGNADDQSILFIVGNDEYVWYYKYQSLFTGLGVILGLALTLGIVVMVFMNVNRRVNRI